MIVLDASVALELLLGGDRFQFLRGRVLDRAEQIHAPHLIDLEVLQVIRRYWLRGEISTARAEEALTDYEQMRMVLHPHHPLRERIWSLRDSLTCYDAAYVALAEALGAPLLTRDARMAGAPGIGAVVEVI